ncbi:MAG TPA: gliding motility-associated C-terminal domain-containing protein [Bacteroidia bacterium]|nr:gliding motility-associated C-terminal domain-containing protein [Bacteroidia bacterium]
MAVNSVSVQSVNVSSIVGFGAGDRVLIIQMKGASVNTNNTPTFGTITNYNDAGNYEFTTIASVSGTTINFTSPLLRTYIPSGLVQLVKVPVYVNAVVTGVLSTLAWNGVTGGVLVFEASGNVTLNANIDVSGKGFRGGNLQNGAFSSCAGDTSDYVLPFSTIASGQKGEGIVDLGSAMSNGKGQQANGGGAGNDCNAGGAGGGNYGMGGHGGDSKVNVSCPPFFYQNSGGRWGDALVYSNAINKVFMGGGGGAPHENDGAGTPGVSGAGIVIIRATSLIGNSNSIISNGSDNLLMAGIDGQGGGGAGGSVLIDACTITSLNVSVKGGKGGVDNFGGSDCHGKGGGGGGGIIWVSSSLTGITANLAGGLPGVFTNSGSLCFNTSNGATQGQSGGTLTGLIIPGTTPMLGGNFVIDTSICINSTVQLNPGTANSYTWSTGSNNQTITIGSEGTYWVEMTPSNGCSIVDTFKVHLVTAGLYDVIKDTVICNDIPIVLNASTSNVNSYNWSTGSTNSSISVGTGGVYWVDLHIDQCVVRDSATITYIVPVHVLKDTSICFGNSVVLNASATGATSYQWSTGSSNSSIQVNNSGVYWVNMNIGQCIDKDTAIVTVITDPKTLTDTTACNTNGHTITASGGTSYLWSTGAITPSIIAVSSGEYWVDVHINNCLFRDSMHLSLVTYPKINIVSDTFICADPVILNVVNPKGNLTWFNGIHSYSVIVNSPGIYNVSLSDSGCTTLKSINVTRMYSLNDGQIPNVFTPNDDTTNQYFEIKNTGGMFILEFTIYNRWGIKVYTTTGLIKWDGKQNNDIADDGTYYWVATMRDLCDPLKKTVKKKGFITLIK